MASPDPTLPKPVMPRLAPLLGPTAASSVLVAGTCLAALLDAWTAWYRHGVVVDYVAGAPGVWVADLTSADATSRTAGVLYLIAAAAAGIALLVWLSRTRTNARLLGTATRPLRRRLAIGGWFAVSLVVVATMFLYPDPSVADLSVLATVQSVAAVVQCAVGALVLAVVAGARWETNHPGRAMRG